MNTIIINAIKNRYLLKFIYKGHQRIVEPHAYGITTKNNEVLRAYQTGGTSDYGKVPDWRLFSVNKIENLIISNGTFLNPRYGYKSGDSAMDDIYCEL